MQEPVVWVDPDALVTERIPQQAPPLRSAVSFWLIASVAWIVPVHTVAALTLGLTISAVGVIAGTQS